MYVKNVLNELSSRYPWEKEFIVSVTEVFESIEDIIERGPAYKKYKILERIVEPERIISFRVPWRDDRGEVQVNTGYRIEFNSALGPYKGGLRFHSSVNQSIMKFLAFEQTFKNALTGLPMGGAKGGSNFNPRGKSDAEIMSFCQSFMSELFRHIGANTDIPAGDIGVGTREIGYLFGQYKRLKNTFEGVLTGKGINWGGSLVRPEATGYGVVYFANEMLKTKGIDIKGKIVAISGFGNVAWGTVKKLSELSARVVTLSGPDGFIHDPEGITDEEKINYLLEMRISGKDEVKSYADKFKVKFYPGKKPWGIKCDLAIPCATQNELDINDANELLKNKVIVVAEGANLPCTQDAVKLFRNNKISFAPGKAANAGGVSCSGLEMSQNSMRISWSRAEVDARLQEIMINIHNDCWATAHEFGKAGDYVDGANIKAFKKVSDAMMDLGIV
ncbi:MAG: NADP-specific glutamate dehydrogenase [Oligoflexia bacterium]|nr:NADP-specific glutamate dehydrogenase [Oligoflexia bacterium]